MDMSINNIDLNTSHTAVMLLNRSDNKEQSAVLSDIADLTTDLKDFIQKALLYDKQQLEMAQKAQEILNTNDYDNPENIEFAAENLLKLGI